MTSLKGDLRSIMGTPFGGVGHAVLIFSRVTRAAFNSDSVVLQLHDRIEMPEEADGKFRVDGLDPGPVRVELEGGTVHNHGWNIDLPDEGTWSLADLVDAQVDWSPAVIGRAEAAAREARDHADRAEAGADRVGTAEQVGTWADEASSSASDADSARSGAVTARDAAQSARDAAEGHANRAATSESNAKASETNAKQSEDNAGDYAAVATTAATEAVDAMGRATEIAGGDLSKKVDKDDSRLPLVRPGEYAAVIGDGEYAALAVTRSGAVDFRRATSETKASIMGSHDAVRAVESDNEHYVFRVADRDGNIALAIDRNGAVDFRRATPETANLLKSILGQAPTPVEPEEPNATGNDVWVPDKDDSGLHATHVATGLRTLLSDTAQEATPVGNAIVWVQDGVQMYRKNPLEPAWKATDRTRLSFWGSSSIQESHGQLTAMAKSFGITDVMRGGMGSDRGRHILGRMGAAPFTLKNSVTIPETGSVEFDTTNGTPLNMTHAWTPGTLGGIPGRISHRGSRYTFSRDTEGQATSLPAGTEFIPDSVEYRDAPAILQLGKNDISAEGASGEIVLEQTEIAYRWLRTLPEWVAVLGHHVNSNWAGDDYAAKQVKLANDLCRERYGERFIDLQAYLSSSQVWDDTGLTPSQEDLDRQAAGVMPLALARDTGAHMNDIAKDAYVNNLIVPHLNKIGWF